MYYSARHAKTKTSTSHRARRVGSSAVCEFFTENQRFQAIPRLQQWWQA
jgi:hypothetical protein